MDRRELLVAVGIGLAGCTTRDGGSTPTGTAPATGTQASGLGTIEYTVTNEDDETHQLEVAMENAEGRIVQETNEPEFAPGASVSSGSAGESPDLGPYTLTFRTDSASATYVWDVAECARIHLQVTITTDGSITVERDLCQN